MKVLWFEVSEPSAYASGGEPIGGWQDSLERIVRTIPTIDLMITFVSEKHSEIKVVNGVTYIPIKISFSFFERKFGKYWDLFVEKMLPRAKSIVEHYNPDVIHVFGTEWPFGQIAAYTDVPVVIHIMGSIVPYRNAKYPPNYSYKGRVLENLFNPRRLWNIWNEERNMKNWEKWERSSWKLVNNFMGRTQWDKSLSCVMHPGRRYFHVEEALRADFICGGRRWKGSFDTKIYLISTGCTTFWKGPDMMLKTAKILKNLGVDFEWKVVGKMPCSLKNEVENHEGLSFEDCNISILGFKKTDELMEVLCTSTLYVHTAYIENSPNSICEAQCLGLPVLSTNVGGISTLVHHDIDGYLVPANDPWQMANAVVELSKDKERMKRYSENGRNLALKRHDDENICQQLLKCYSKIKP